MQPHSPSGQDSAAAGHFAFNRILTGDARVRLAQLPEASVDLSFWSPPYYVGKSYERHLSFDDWRELLRDVIHRHRRIVKPGGFLVVNIGDILCFPDPAMPKFQANNVRRKTQAVTTEQVLAARKRPGITRYDRERLTPREWADWGSRGVWHIRSVSRNHRHEAEFPEELAARVIRLFSPPGGVVLDPFVGAGTTTKVAKLLGRQWLGIDLEAAHAQLARRRTDDARTNTSHGAGVHGPLARCAA